MDGVDAFRLIAMLGVIVIHTTPFIDDGARAAGRIDSVGVFINQLARFAIPFFFTMSGYFWGRKVRVGPPLRVSGSVIRRLLKLFLFWTLLLLLPWDVSSVGTLGLLAPLKVAYWNALGLLSSPLELLFAGSVQSLWFLVALCCSVAIATLFVAAGRPLLLLLVAAFLYVIGVLGGGYADTPVGIHMSFNTLYGPFCGTLPFTIGYLLSSREPRKGWLHLGLAIAGVGFILHFTEIYYLWKTFDSYPLKHYDFSTWILGLGTALIALADRPFPGREVLARNGRLAIGIYLVQPVFVGVGNLIGHYLRAAWWEVGQVMFVTVLSILAVRLMMRHGLLRQFVT